MFTIVCLGGKHNRVFVYGMGVMATFCWELGHDGDARNFGIKVMMA